MLNIFIINNLDSQHSVVSMMSWVKAHIQGFRFWTHGCVFGQSLALGMVGSLFPTCTGQSDSWSDLVRQQELTCTRGAVPTKATFSEGN